jgi:hypothetical protein
VPQGDGAPLSPDSHGGSAGAGAGAASETTIDSKDTTRTSQMGGAEGSNGTGHGIAFVLGRQDRGDSAFDGPSSPL